MELFLRRVIHPQAHDNYRVILKVDGVEIELGSIGLQYEGWVWGFDTVIPMRELETEGSGKRDVPPICSPDWAEKPSPIPGGYMVGRGRLPLNNCNRWHF
jgi:hypothetical protein